MIRVNKRAFRYKPWERFDWTRRLMAIYFPIERGLVYVGWDAHGGFIESTSQIYQMWKLPFFTYAIEKKIGKSGNQERHEVQAPHSKMNIDDMACDAFSCALITATFCSYPRYLFFSRSLVAIKYPELIVHFRPRLWKFYSMRKCGDSSIFFTVCYRKLRSLMIDKWKRNEKKANGVQCTNIDSIFFFCFHFMYFSHVLHKSRGSTKQDVDTEEQNVNRAEPAYGKYTDQIYMYVQPISTVHLQRLIRYDCVMPFF